MQTFPAYKTVLITSFQSPFVVLLSESGVSLLLQWILRLFLGHLVSNAHFLTHCVFIPIAYRTIFYFALLIRLEVSMLLMRPIQPFKHRLINCSLSKSFCFIFQHSFFLTMPNVSPRQGTRLTRPDPRPHIEGTLHWIHVNRWSHLALA